MFGPWFLDLWTQKIHLQLMTRVTVWVCAATLHCQSYSSELKSPDPWQMSVNHLHDNVLHV